VISGEGFQGSLHWNEPLSRHTYYRIGGPAFLVAQPKAVSDLHWLASLIKSEAKPYFILGLGSNVLAADEGFSGIVIKPTKMDYSISDGMDSEVKGRLGGEVLIKAGAGASISTFLKKAASHGWVDFLLWAGIPGSVGGAVSMNAGTHLGETANLLESVSVFDLENGKEKTYSKEELKFAYRKNLFLAPSEVVTSAVFKSRVEDPASVARKIKEMLERRKASQPIEMPSCGSVFKNPDSMHAWQVIEKVGLRGHTIGAAQFSEKHCNFIVNRGGAKASEVRALIEKAKELALDKMGIELQEEVKYLQNV
jgi:UDP-N-acetylmuramate dehydrogenase